MKNEPVLKEWFIDANSFAAPFFSDQSTHFQTAETPEDALMRFAKRYKHPCGLYAAACYESSDAYHKNKKPLARWLSNSARVRGEYEKKGCMMMGKGPGCFEADGKEVIIKNPKEGAVCK